MKLSQATFIIPLLMVNTTHSTPITSLVEKLQRSVAALVTYASCAQSESTVTDHEYAFVNSGGKLTITNLTQGSIVYKTHDKDSTLHVRFVGPASHLGTVAVQCECLDITAEVSFSEPTRYTANTHNNCATITTGTAPKTSSLDIIVHGPERLKSFVTRARNTHVDSLVCG